MVIVALLVASLMIFLTVDAFPDRSPPIRARNLRIGDTRQQVRRVLGQPSEITVAGIFDPSETWAYGGRINWQHLSIRFRIFGPDADEVAIQFDKAGKVRRVIIPKQNQQ